MRNDLASQKLIYLPGQRFAEGDGEAGIVEGSDQRAST